MIVPNNILIPIVGCPRIEKNKERDVIHQAVCKVPQLPKKRMGRCMVSYERSRRRGDTQGEEQCGGRKLSERVYLTPPL